jgi:hypothetical protein
VFSFLNNLAVGGTLLLRSSSLLKNLEMEALVSLDGLLLW